MKELFEMLTNKRDAINELCLNKSFIPKDDFNAGMLAGIQQLACWLLSPDDFMEPIRCVLTRDAEQANEAEKRIQAATCVCASPSLYKVRGYVYCGLCGKPPLS